MTDCASGDHDQRCDVREAWLFNVAARSRDTTRVGALCLLVYLMSALWPGPPAMARMRADPIRYVSLLILAFGGVSLLLGLVGHVQRRSRRIPGLAADFWLAVGRVLLMAAAVAGWHSLWWMASALQAASVGTFALIWRSVAGRAAEAVAPPCLAGRILPKRTSWLMTGMIVLPFLLLWWLGIIGSGVATASMVLLALVAGLGAGLIMRRRLKRAGHGPDAPPLGDNNDA